MGGAGGQQVPGCDAFWLPLCVWSLISAPLLRAEPLNQDPVLRRVPRKGKAPSTEATAGSTQGWLQLAAQAGPRHLFQPHTTPEVPPLCFKP